MPKTEDSTPPRPSLTLRLGITGARKLPPDQLDRIRSQLKDVFECVKAEMARLSSLKEVTDSYAPEPGALVPRIYLITPLALGADRLAASEALDQGCEVYVPMPFPRAVYEEDFTGCEGNPSDAKPVATEEDCAEFRQLLSRASGMMELDGVRKSAPDDDGSAGKAYEAVGRFVVRHCDLLLAVWDGKPSNGRGGTAEIVHYAASAGVPVWWIHAQKDTEPEWLADIQDIQDPVPPGPEALPVETKLQIYLKRLISPPANVTRHRASWLENLASTFEEKEISPLNAYFMEKPRPPRFIWKTFSIAMGWLGRKGEGRLPASPPGDPVAHYWFSRFAIADENANDYAARYRSSYLLTILLTTLALLCGACALGLRFSHWTHAKYYSLGAACFELLTLFLIVILVATALRREWHAKSIEYRLLAELLRKEQTLAMLGWALSVGNVQRLADTDRLSWVAWLFAATQRCAPLLEGSIGNESRRRILLNLIDQQLAYHKGREAMALKASKTLEKFSSLTFGAVLIFVLLKVVTELAHDEYGTMIIILGLLATVLPGISAAFVAIRSYAELQLLAEQSHHMILELHGARSRVLRLDTNRALVSQDLGAQAASLATLMLQDLDGWGRLFRGKLMEAS
jgi:hypothetical protein